MSRLILNDRPIDCTLAPDTPLLDALRDTWGLTAAKPGCGTGDCGTCLVLVGARQDADGEVHYLTMNSCLLTLAQVDGCHVITAEGLAADGPVQRALVASGAIQCGYCTPGIAIALTGGWLAMESPEVAVAGNLCRCTGYAGIRRACDALASSLPSATATGARTLDDAAQAGLLAPGVAEAGLTVNKLPSAALPGSPGARTLAGATEWLPQHPHAPHHPGMPVLLRRVPGLNGITVENGIMIIGAATTVAELGAHALVRHHWPALPGYLERFASPSVRHSATVGGNLVNASPVADLAVLLLAMDAELVLDSDSGRRHLPLHEFFQGYHQTARKPNEYLVQIRVALDHAPARLFYDKISNRRLDDMAIVNLALCLRPSTDGRMETLRLSAGGVAPIPCLLRQAMATLDGGAPTPDTVLAALAALVADIAPQDDLHGSAAYKSRLLQHMVLAQLADAFPSLDWQGCVP